MSNNQSVKELLQEMYDVSATPELWILEYGRLATAKEVQDLYSDLLLNLADKIGVELK